LQAAVIEEIFGRPPGSDRQAEHVDGRLEQLGIDSVPEQRGCLIGLDQVPKAVDDQRRVRLVGL
jgi:hypothetical protein